MEWRFTFPTVSLLILMLALTSNQAQARVFDIKKFGAVGDGKTDNSKALYDVWKGACRSKGTNVIVIPSGTYLLGPVVLTGPCNGAIEFQIKGTLRASNSPQLGIDHWITFRFIDRLRITGGVLDGQGAASWPCRSQVKITNVLCDFLPLCVYFHQTMRLDFVTKAWIRHVTSLNSKNFHFNLFSCKDITFDHVTITAPEDSPNTDGIHMGRSSNVFVRDSVISTGDDCISLGPGSKNIKVTGIACGPGHGISVGSLGGTPNEPPVTTVFVRNCTFTDTQNGMRIKTRAPSYQGVVQDITFQDIIVKNAGNPIIIDQQYCPSKKCRNQASKVKISDVGFRNIRGTTSSLVAVNINCSPAVP
ncbi:hypothetical protein EUGRSUZ_F00633 [Eucalyptus grandis]|uniref:Uncharacterized protein n=2 Tax=Eucalyptus grandis TaxID=71139 RepID=A0ACC3KBL9_EUCGR|nr:hypothetical protein EUGRSUZ_F00633 [Eucalyptus grandis]